MGLVRDGGDRSGEVIHPAIDPSDASKKHQTIRIFHDRGSILANHRVEKDRLPISIEPVVRRPAFYGRGHHSPLAYIPYTRRLQKDVVSFDAAEGCELFCSGLNEEGASLTSKATIHGQEHFGPGRTLPVAILRELGETGNGDSLGIEIHPQDLHAP